MIESLQIIIAFFCFSILIMVPFNIFNSKKIFHSNYNILDLASFNLIINCTVLFFFSILPIALKDYNLIFYIILVTIFFYSYVFKSKNINNFKDYYLQLILFFLVFFIVSIDVASKLNLGWDAKFFYYIKALFFTEGQNFYDLNKFEYVFHPHLGSFLWAFYWELLPSKLEYMGRLFYVFIACFSIFYVCHKNLKYSLMDNIIFISLILLFYKYERFSGLQEILIFSFLVITSKFYSKILNINNKYFIIFSILLCNLLIWTKAEGMVYAIIILMLLNLNSKIFFKVKIYINLSFLFIFFLKYFIYEISDNVMLDTTGSPYFISYFLDLNYHFIIHKLKLIIPYLLYYILNNIFFISGVIILIYKRFLYPKNNYNKIIELYCLINLIFIFAAYLLRDVEIEFAIKTTMERIVFSASGFYCFLLVDFLKNTFNNVWPDKKIYSNHKNNYN